MAGTKDNVDSTVQPPPPPPPVCGNDTGDVEQDNGDDDDIALRDLMDVAPEVVAAVGTSAGNGCGMWWKYPVDEDNKDDDDDDGGDVVVLFVVVVVGNSCDEEIEGHWLELVWLLVLMY